MKKKEKEETKKQKKRKELRRNKRKEKKRTAAESRNASAEERRKEKRKIDQSGSSGNLEHDHICVYLSLCNRKDKRMRSRKCPERALLMEGPIWC
jgi:hypothetical protein